MRPLVSKFSKFGKKFVHVFQSLEKREYSSLRGAAATTITAYMRELFQYLGLAFVLLAAGCVQIEQDLTLKADGSGVLRLSYVAAEAEGTLTQQAAREMLRQTLAMNGGGTRLPQDMSDAEIRTQFAGYAKHGVKLEQLTTERKGQQMIRRATVSFKTLSGLVRALLPERTLVLSRTARGDYTLTQQPGGGDNLVNRFAGIAADESNPLTAELFKGFRATLRINVPGRVQEANAAQAAQKTAVWQFDFDRDAQALAKLLQRPMRLTFEGGGLNLTPFVYKAGTR